MKIMSKSSKEWTNYSKTYQLIAKSSIYYYDMLHIDITFCQLLVF